MLDFNWLAAEAKHIHQVFQNLFYPFCVFLLLLGILVEFFKFPLGEMPSFSRLVGRVLIAAILLNCFPEVMELISSVSDAIAKAVGDLNRFDVIRSRMADKLDELSWSWLSVKDTVSIVICYISFILFHFSYYVANAFFLYTWTLLYIFSPLLIALYILPATAPATTALYRSLIEVSSWKIVWSVLATLLWSAALSDMNKPQYEVSFLTVICYNLILAGSLLLTPLVVHTLTRSGLSSLTRNLGPIGLGAAAFAPSKIIKTTALMSKRGYNASHAVASSMTERYFPKAHDLIQKVPRFHIPKKSPLFERKVPNEKVIF